jgi:NAD(P)-dependent dehydrogenase (short-subunit alcohol dehydrogenase family)
LARRLGGGVRGLTGKVVVVAGGAGGIGTATCRRLAEEGAHVVVGDLDADAAAAVARDIGNAGGRAVAVGVDISEEASVAALFEAATQAFGPVDAVHINAADLSPATIGGDSDALDESLDIFDHTLSVNLRGHFLVTRAALPCLLDRGGGALAYTSSAAAFVGEPQRPAYAVAKSGVNALVRHVASRWGREGIRANAVAPGLILTPRAQAGLSDEFRRHAMARTRSPRLGAPEDIAAMVALLLSDDGSWINGQVISVDGGSTLR